jgi:hypothetical protein
MSRNKKAKINLSKYERIKKILLDNWIFAVIALLASGIILGGNIVQGFNAIQDWITPKMTMVVTVIDQGVDCGMEIMKRSTLDVAINNNSNKSVILTSVKLIPEWVSGSFYAGELEVAGNYTVSLASWHDLVMKATIEPETFASLLKAGKVREGKSGWVKPDPIEVKEISEKKFTIERHGQERFQIRMGLGRPIDYLMGTVFLEIKTDNGITLRSKALEISICENGKEGK